MKSFPFLALTSNELLMVMDKLPPEELLNIRLNHELKEKSAEIWQTLWKNKLKRHFPHVYNTLRSAKGPNWYSEFKKTYRYEYRNFDSDYRRYFSLIKESDLEGIEKAAIAPHVWELATSAKKFELSDRNGKTLLFWAQEIGNKEVLNYFFSQAKKYFFSQVKKYYDKNRTVSYFPHLLHTAVAFHQNYHQIMYLATTSNWSDEKLANVDLDLKFLDEDKAKAGGVLLAMAAKHGHLPLLHHLLATQSDVKLDVSINGGSALKWAASRGDVKMVRELMKAEAKSPPNNRQLPPIYEAIAKGHLPVVQAIIEAHPELLNGGGNSNEDAPLFYAVEKGNLPIVEYLLAQKGINIEAKKKFSDGNTATAIYIAAAQGEAEIAKKLLQGGADPGWLQPLSPLHIAIAHRKLEAVKAFIETKPELLTQADAEGLTPLLFAIKKNQLEIVQYLLAHKDIVLAAKALSLAIENSNLDMVKLLLKHTPNLLNLATMGEGQDRLTALMWAAQKSRLAITQFLLAHDGIDLLATYRGKRALDLADESSPVFDALLLAHAQHHLPVAKEKLSASARKNPKVLLIDYLAKRESEPVYKTSWSFFGFIKNFGFSREEKLNAANALKAVMFNNEDAVILESHQGALQNGELKGIYRKYLATRSEAHANKRNSRP